jgi:hypothetical protein
MDKDEQVEEQKHFQQDEGELEYLHSGSVSIATLATDVNYH